MWEARVLRKKMKCLWSTHWFSMRPSNVFSLQTSEAEKKIFSNIRTNELLYEWNNVHSLLLRLLFFFSYKFAVAKDRWLFFISFWLVLSPKCNNVVNWNLMRPLEEEAAAKKVLSAFLLQSQYLVYWIIAIEMVRSGGRLVYVWKFVKFQRWSESCLLQVF